MVDGMKNAHNGSMILTCMFFISIIMMIMLLHWRSEEAIQTTMIMRATMVKAQYGCEALMEYGTDLCKSQYALLAKGLSERGRPLLLTFERWPLGNETYGQGIIEISYTKQFLITATILQDRHTLVTLSCCLERESRLPHNIFTISAWKRHELKA
jgi:hypothetical protein